MNHPDKQRNTMPGRAPQRGQALVFTLLFAAIALVMALVLYNSGKLATTKSQLQNAADAGAYSGAVLMARDHNFAAYTNRAMVANQVSVAQLVSLKSYVDDAAATHRRIKGPAHTIIADTIPYSIGRIPWNIASALPIEPLAAAYDAVAPTAVVALDKLIGIMQLAQEAHHLATSVYVALVANQVVKRNDPNAGVSMLTFQTAYTANQIKEWASYTTKKKANEATPDADRFANVVVSRESTDELVRKRGNTLVASWESLPTEIACPPPSIPIFTLYGFHHDGGTILSANQRRWLALDATQGAGVVICETELLIPFFYLLPQDGPGGSAGALAGSAGRYGSRTGFSGNPSETRSYGGALNGLAAIPANVRYNKGPGASMDASGGLQNYYRDVAETAKTPDNQRADLNGAERPFTIEVRHEGNTIRTSTRVLGAGANVVKADEALKGDTLRALASGAAYFFRAKTDTPAFNRAGWRRADGRTEMANLFNPYWQAQLVENPPAALAASVAAP